MYGGATVAHAIIESQILEKWKLFGCVPLAQAA
jgi:hypothetical protein